MEFSGKKIAILGFGTEGLSVARFLLSKKADFFIFDEKNEGEFEGKATEELKANGAKFEFGHFPAIFKEFDFVVRSPGISLNSEVIKKAKKEGVKITSATKIFFEICPAKIIGITGTKGKGTTSALIYEMLKKQGKDVYLGGNIGTSPLDFVGSLNSDSWVVLELSSFQLADLAKSPQIAVLLMTTSEHLDYHKDVNEYVDAKRNILRFQKASDYAVVNRDYPASNESDICTDGKVYYVSRVGGIERGAYFSLDSLWFRENEEDIKVIDVKDILIPGKHNYENAMAASIAAFLAGVSFENVKKVLSEFKGLEHRLELVRTVNGVRYYDDSFSTTPETAIAAIEAFSEPEILILGGSSKNSDFSDLGKVISEAKNIKAIIGIGEEWLKIKAGVENLGKITIIEECRNMQEIVQKAVEIGEIGDVVLLSPACASFDMFPNYKERGNMFKQEVLKLV